MSIDARVGRRDTKRKNQAAKNSDENGCGFESLDDVLSLAHEISSDSEGAIPWIILRLKFQSLV